MALTIDDRIEIQDLLAGYCLGLDDLDWESFSNLFHHNATLDYTAIGGPKGNPQELIELLNVFSTNVSSWQHTTSTNILKSVNGWLITERILHSSWSHNVPD
ncbi:nuclear transport factor 2 family protein [Microbulbifer sp. 2304DJ12-6]|uniref:nuclear transport factor 2 family protein n=1 Tax=Microbulbifer sp. 2304DJ12-6 TaxID=3233340 RepID=UPI0039AEE71D